MTNSLPAPWVVLAVGAGALLVMESAGGVPGASKRVSRHGFSLWVMCTALATAGVAHFEHQSGWMVPLALLAVQAAVTPHITGVQHALWCVVAGLAAQPTTTWQLPTMAVVALVAAGPASTAEEAEAAWKLWWWCALGTAWLGVVLLTGRLGMSVSPMLMMLAGAWWLGLVPLHGLWLDAVQALAQPLLLPALVWTALGHVDVPPAARMAGSAVGLAGVLVLALLAHDAVHIRRVCAALALSLVPLAWAGANDAGQRALVTWGMAGVLLAGRVLAPTPRSTWEHISGSGRSFPVRVGLAWLVLFVVAGAPATPYFQLRAQASVTALAAAEQTTLTPSLWGLAWWFCGLAGMFTALRLAVFCFAKEPRHTTKPGPIHGVVLWFVCGAAMWFASAFA
jgi:hypothetical protein